MKLRVLQPPQQQNKKPLTPMASTCSRVDAVWWTAFFASEVFSKTYLISHRAIFDRA
jgi:hypothetical protein